MSDGTPDTWGEEVTLMVTLAVSARPEPDFFEGWQGRTPLDAAIAAVRAGRSDLSHIDGFADLIGFADILDVSEL